MTDSPSSDAPGDGQAQRPQPWFPPGGGYGPGSPPQAPSGAGPAGDWPARDRPARDRPAGPAGLARVGPAGLRTAWTWPAGYGQPGYGQSGYGQSGSGPSGSGPPGIRAAATRPVAALWRGSTQARRDPAPAAGRRRDPRRRLRLHPPQSQGHPGPRRRGHDDLSGHLRRDHPHAAQPGQPQPAHPGPATDDCPGHPPGGPHRRGGPARVRAEHPADHHRAGHPGRAARPDHRPGRRRPADQCRGRLADHPPAAAQPAAGHPAGAAGRARAGADPRA